MHVMFDLVFGRVFGKYSGVCFGRYSSSPSKVVFFDINSKKILSQKYGLVKLRKTIVSMGILFHHNTHVNFFDGVMMKSSAEDVSTSAEDVSTSAEE